MKEITYSLRSGPKGSEGYYEDASAFAGEVLAETEGLAGELVGRFMRQLGEDPVSEPELKQEHGFELLVLGTLWRVYSGDAAGLDKAPGSILSRLSRFRSVGGVLKPGIDFVRGIISTLFLAPDLYDSITISDPTAERFEKLLDWLEATGEFNREVEKLRIWQSYILTLSDRDAGDLLATALTLAAWFEGSSLEALGRYTANVDDYLDRVRQYRYWHEDVIFCGRRRVEYHLNMVGAEIMNRIYRKNFLAAKRKVVIIPACMRILPTNGCKASYEDGALVCRGCSRDCGVNGLRALGKQHGFEVLMVPHESSLSSSKSEKPILDGDTGVIGIACVLNLVSGGWMLRKMGVPPQCVLLDYCGCKNHWSRDGVPTTINISQLLRVLGKEL